MWFFTRNEKKLISQQKEETHREAEEAAARCRTLEEANFGLNVERAELRGRLESQQTLLQTSRADADTHIRQIKEAADLQLKEAKEAADQQLKEVREAASRQLNEAKEAADQQLKEVKEGAERRVALVQSEAQKLRQESDAQWQLKFDKLREEIKSLTTHSLQAKQADLQDTNRQQMGELLKPIREQFEQFRKAIDESRTSGEVAKKELKSSFEATMKLFEQQQKMTVEELRRETNRIGEDAANLTRALKRDSKVQGDWGEMILDTLLESSGLERDVHYFIQENVKSDDGNNRRPDVVVRFPQGRAVIIDSKVSLTAYVESFETTDESVRQRKLKEHARSVRRHIEELAGKQYDDLVEDSVSFVLMFIPNDQCYLAAIEQDSTLVRDAYAKGIIIISPSNLMTALQLSYNMWQRDRQNKNIEEIVREATAIYEKAATFTETFLRAESQLATVAKTFAQARGQMYDGAGNFLRRLETLRAKGLTPKKSIKGLKPIYATPNLLEFEEATELEPADLIEQTEDNDDENNTDTPTSSDNQK